MARVKHLTMEELEAGLDDIRQSPRDQGVLELIVRRPRADDREVLQDGVLDLAEGLVGDNWKSRGSAADGSLDPDTQLTVINSRVSALVAQSKNRWQLAGDQLYIDMDLSIESLPAGTQLAIGSAVIEITDQPHTGCSKFAARFGPDATKFVNSPAGKQLHLRGVYARVIQAGVVRIGDVAQRMSHTTDFGARADEVHAGVDR